MQAFDSLVEPAWRRALLALAVAVALFAAGLLVMEENLLDDDYAFTVALSGRYPSAGPGLDGICLFLNTALCQGIYGLFSAVPQVNWFTVVEASMCCAAFAVMLYVAFGLPRREMGFAFALGCIALILRYCTYKNNFTAAAFMCICAGGLLLLSRLVRQERAVGALVAGTALMAIGFAWRSEMLLLCLPLFGATALWLALRRDGERPRQPVRLIPFFAALALCAGLYAYDQAAWDKPELQEWLAYNDARSALVDYPTQDYEQVADELAAIGVSENDYWMVTHWFTEDPDFFTTQRLEQIAEVAAVHDGPAQIARKTATELASLAVDQWPMVVFFVVLMIAILASTRGATRLFCLGIVALTIVLMLVLLALGRLPARVSYPLWLYAAACCMAATFGHAAPEGKHARRSEGAKGRPLLATAYCFGMVAVSVLFAGYALFRFDARMATAIIDMDAFACNDPLVTYQQQHPDKMWAYDARSYAFLENAYCLRAVPPAETLASAITLGGWGERSPFINAHNAQAGIDNPIRSLVERDDVVYIAYNEKMHQHLEAYLREHYYPQVSSTVEPVPNHPEALACTFAKA